MVTCGRILLGRSPEKKCLFKTLFCVFVVFVVVVIVVLPVRAGQNGWGGGGVDLSHEPMKTLQRN